MPSGFSFELDTGESAWLWHAGWGADPVGVSVVSYKVACGDLFAAVV